MPRALSEDLRERVVKAVEGGMTQEEAAAHFGVDRASVVRWKALKRRKGSLKPGSIGGPRRQALNPQELEQLAER